MIATNELVMSDLSKQRRLTARLDDDLTVDHTVDHAIELYLDRMRIPDNGLPWAAFSRGVRLDRKQRLADLTEADDTWTVVPEVSAG
jgi:hypothetical protein